MRGGIQRSGSQGLPTASGHGPWRAAFVLIANLSHLASAYGAPFAGGVSAEIQRRCRAYLTLQGAADGVCIRDDCLLLWVRDASCADPPGPADEILAQLVELGAAPVHAHGVQALAQLHVGWADVPARELLTTAEAEFVRYEAQSAAPLAESRYEGSWQRYREDMEVAVHVYAALKARQIEHVWYPVAAARAPATSIAYRSGSTGIAAGASHGLLGAGVFVPCLERLGLARLFDRAMVRQVVDTLRCHPTLALGARISAQSATLDHFWADLLRTLADDSALARRLVIEIGGGVGLPALESACDLCMHLQMCGSRIAVTGVGRGSIGLAGLCACRPDIAKLDDVFVRNARTSAFGLQSLQDMLPISAHLAPQVVVDGIECEEDFHAALRAGAHWLQGSYFGRSVLPAGACLPHAVPANDEPSPVARHAATAL